MVDYIMNNTQEKYYRVIKPYDSNVLHSATSLMGGASKCYKEFKKVSPYSSSFSVIQMQTNKIYDFEVNNIMKGGAESVVGVTDIKRLENEIDSLKKRIVDLENKVNPSQTIPTQPTQPTTQPTQPTQPTTQLTKPTTQLTQPTTQLTQLTQATKPTTQPTTQPTIQPTTRSMSEQKGGFNYDLVKKFI